MISIDCTACIHADDDGNCTLDVTTTSFEDGCCDFAERDDRDDADSD